MRLGKRIFDLVVGVIGVTLTWPLLLFIGVLVKLEDGGPVLFQQERIGLFGKPFRILKFRSMVLDAEKRGPQITVGRDPRVTRVGSWLRKTKLDELPQLFNVIRGEMSMVGPRPEVPRYVAMYTEEQRRVLTLVPGITDLASIRFRHENDLLALSEDPERTYVEEVMPEKIRINISYAQNASVFSDILVIIQTVLSIVSK